MGSDDAFLFDKEHPFLPDKKRTDKVFSDIEKRYCEGMSICHPEYYNRYPTFGCTEGIPTISEKDMTPEEKKELDTVIKRLNDAVDNVTDDGNDRVTHPIHYTHGDLECWDVAKYFPYLEGNIIKYIWRHNYKNGAEDVKKAIMYCQKLLEKDYGVKATTEFKDLDKISLK